MLALIQAVTTGVADTVLNQATLVQLLMTFGLPLVQEGLKRLQGFPWLTVRMTEANTVISVVGSFLSAAMGLQYETGVKGNMSMVCIYYPATEIMLRGIASFLVQRTFYQKVLRPTLPPPPPQPPLTIPVEPVRPAVVDIHAED